MSGQNDPVLPERSHYFDAGVDQKSKFGCGSDRKSCSTLELGVDAYYKIATDLIDNGLFGQALVLSAFNYARGYNEGIEFKAKFTSGNFQAYGNVAVAQQRANDPVSNQFLFDNTTPLADPRRLDRASVRSDALHLYRSQPVRHRLGGRHLLSSAAAQRRRRKRLATTGYRGAASS